MIYATLQDLQDRIRRPLTTAETTPAETALSDASLELDVLYPLPDPAGTNDLAVRKIVVCRMVIRAFTGPVDALGVSSTQQGAGPFQQSLSFENPMGDLYLTKADRRLLRGRNSAVGSVDLLAHHATTVTP